MFCPADVKSDECRFSLMESESTEHFLPCCHVVSAFWREVQRTRRAVEVNIQAELSSATSGDVVTVWIIWLLCKEKRFIKKKFPFSIFVGYDVTKWLMATWVFVLFLRDWLNVEGIWCLAINKKMYLWKRFKTEAHNKSGNIVFN